MPARSIRPPTSVLSHSAVARILGVLVLGCMTFSTAWSAQWDAAGRDSLLDADGKFKRLLTLSAPPFSQLRLEDAAVLKVDDVTLYWPLETGSGAVRSKTCGAAPRTYRLDLANVTAFVSDAPTSIFTRESLWNRFRPVLERALDAICPQWKDTAVQWRQLTINLSIYFAGVYLTENYDIGFGYPPATALMPPAAFATFNWFPEGSRHTENASVSTFAPTIFGHQGWSGKGKFHMEMADFVPDAKVAYEADYANFPQFDFLDVLSAYGPAVRSFIQRQREIDELRRDPMNYLPYIVAAVAGMQKSACETEAMRTPFISPRCDDLLYGNQMEKEVELALHESKAALCRREAEKSKEYCKEFR